MTLENKFNQHRIAESLSGDNDPRLVQTPMGDNDPRLVALRASRRPRTDAPAILGYQIEDIAWSRHEVTAQTKVYIGPPVAEILSQFDGLELIFSPSFEGVIIKDTVIIDTKNKNELLEETEKNGIRVSFHARELMSDPDFMPPQVISGNGKKVNLVRLTVQDLGFNDYPTTIELFARAKDFGLEVCPAEVGLQYRLQHADQPMGEQLHLGMEPWSVLGKPAVFWLARDHETKWLGLSWADPDHGWLLNDHFVFQLPETLHKP